MTESEQVQIRMQAMNLAVQILSMILNPTPDKVLELAAKIEQFILGKK